MKKNVYENSCIYGDSNSTYDMSLAEVRAAMRRVAVCGDRIDETPDVCITRTITFVPESLAEREMLALATARWEAMCEARLTRQIVRDAEIASLRIRNDYPDEEYPDED